PLVVHSVPTRRSSDLERMGEIRRYFDAKYGTGKLVSRTRDTDSDVVQTLVGYQWTIGATMLELFYFSAQHDALVFRTISVDYKRSEERRVGKEGRSRE